MNIYIISRVPFIRNGIQSYQPLAVTQSFPVPPLSGYKILDVGCGGGILSESLARLGAQVTGIDPCEESISAASLRASNSKMTNLKYEVTTIEELMLTSSTKFDAITASEVIEHLDNQEYFIQMCSSLLKVNFNSKYILKQPNVFILISLVDHYF